MDGNFASLLVLSIVTVIGMLVTAAAVLWILYRIPEILEVLDRITVSLSAIADSKRLSTVLVIEGKKGLDITPEDFEPKREELRAGMLDALEKALETYRRKTGRIDQPDTAAFVVLNHSGFDQFVDGDVRLKAKSALARLLASQNIPAAKRFITTLARNL